MCAKALKLGDTPLVVLASSLGTHFNFKNNRCCEKGCLSPIRYEYNDPHRGDWLTNDDFACGGISFAGDEALIIIFL